MLTSGGPRRGRNTRPSTPKLNNSFTAITIDYSDQNKRGSRRSTLLGRFIYSMVSLLLINPDYRMSVQDKQWVSRYKVRVGLAGGERVRAGVSQYSRVTGDASNYKT